MRDCGKRATEIEGQQNSVDTVSVQHYIDYMSNTLPNVKPVVTGADLAAASGIRAGWLIAASVHAHRTCKLAKADIYEALAVVAVKRAVRAARSEVR